MIDASSAVMTLTLVRRADLDPDAFRTHWQDVHGPLVRRLAVDLGIRRYVQLHAADAERWDGLALVQFESREDLERRLLTPAGRSAAREIRADEGRFLDTSRTLVAWVRAETIF